MDRKSWYVALSLTFAWLMSFSLAVQPLQAAVTFTSKAITANSLPETNPMINTNGQIVYSGFDGTDQEIYLYNLNDSTTKKITNNKYNDEFPVINKRGQIAWRANKSGDAGADYHMYLYTGGVTNWITGNQYVSAPELNDNGLMTWEGFNGFNSSQIYLYSYGLVKQLSTNNGKNENPKINNKNQVVWQGWDGQDFEIYLSTPGGGVKQITNNTFDDRHPSINDSGQIAWQGAGNYGDEIYLYNGTTTIRITDNYQDDFHPLINSRGQIAWSRYDVGEEDIYMYANGKVVPVTQNTIDDGLIGFDNNGQVFIGQFDGHDDEVYVYSGGVTTRLTNNNYDKLNGHLNANGELVWTQTDGVDTDIWYLKTTPEKIYKYDFTYTYSNEDKYTGWVYATAAMGYAVGKNITVTDELGGTGTYKISAQTETWGVCGQVFVSSYYNKDVATPTTYTLSTTTAAGNNYLKSESGYIITNNVPSYYFGGGYFEADSVNLATDYTKYYFTYTYGSGDTYMGYVSAPASYGYYVGKVWTPTYTDGSSQIQPLLTENWRVGRYEIINMAKGSATNYGSVYVTNYYDFESNSNNVPIHNGTPVGKSYLGSEADYIVADKNPLYYFGPGGRLTTDYFTKAYNVSFYEADKTVTYFDQTFNFFNNNGDYEPVISDNAIVYYGFDGQDYEIYLLDFNRGLQTITNNTYPDMYPVVNNKGQIVWTGWDGQDWEVFLYNNGVIKQLTNNTYVDGLDNYQSEGEDFHTGPKINNNGQVVWRGSDGTDDEIYLYDIATSSTKKISTHADNNTNNDWMPRINDSGQVVWQGFDPLVSGQVNRDLEIYLYKSGTVTKLTNNTTDDKMPQINANGYVAWNWFDGNDGEIMLYKAGGTPVRLTNNTYHDGYRRLNASNQVLYAGFDGNDWEIYLNTSLTVNGAKAITNNTVDDIYPRFNDAGQIVWKGYCVDPERGDGNWEIFTYNAGAITQLTKNDLDDENPLINKSGIIVWDGPQGWGGNNQIHVAGLENYCEYSFKYTYSNGSNGDYYYGKVRTTPNKYYIGYTQTVTAEDGLTGTYTITGMSYLGSTINAGQVIVTSDYYNFENKTSYTPLQKGSVVGWSGLGSEAAYIVKSGVPVYKFGGASEADVGDTYEFKYYYASSGSTTGYDYYTGKVYASPTYGYYPNYKYSPKTNEIGQAGYYLITSMSYTNIAATEYGKVYVTSYYDQDKTTPKVYTGAQLFTPSSAYTYFGVNYLASEYGYFGSRTATTSANYFGGGYYEAD